MSMFEQFQVQPFLVPVITFEPDGGVREILGNCVIYLLIGPVLVC